MFRYCSKTFRRGTRMRFIRLGDSLVMTHSSVPTLHDRPFASGVIPARVLLPAPGSTVNQIVKPCFLPMSYNFFTAR